LIVDEDLGFVGWLGELCSEVGYLALPALNCRQAMSLVKKFRLDVNVLVVNEGLPGVPEMIESLQRGHTPIKIVVIRNPNADGQAMHGHASLDRPSAWEPISRPEWLKKVRGLLKQAAAKAV
jgi:hypothetical protein